MEFEHNIFAYRCCCRMCEMGRELQASIDAFVASLDLVKVKMQHMNERIAALEQAMGKAATPTTEPDPRQLTIEEAMR